MKPNASTAIDVLILTLNAMAVWLDDYKSALDLYLPQTMDEPDEVRAVALTLEVTSSNYQREQREDVAQTAARQAAITQGQTVVRAVITTAEQRFKAAGIHERAIKDFGAVRPSRLIYVSSVRKALRTARQATTSHAATLDQDGKQRSARMIERLDQALAQLDKASEDEVREEQETRVARRAFELAHEAALDAVDELHAAAEAARLDGDAPHEALSALYEVANQRAQQRRAPQPDADPAQPAPGDVI